MTLRYQVTARAYPAATRGKRRKALILAPPINVYFPKRSQCVCAGEGRRCPASVLLAFVAFVALVLSVAFFRRVLVGDAAREEVLRAFGSRDFLRATFAEEIDQLVVRARPPGDGCKARAPSRIEAGHPETDGAAISDGGKIGEEPP